MSGKNGEGAADRREQGPRPRLCWLAAFQIAVIALVLLLSHETRGLLDGPMLEDRLDSLGELPAGLRPGLEGRRAAADAADRVGLRRHPVAAQGRSVGGDHDRADPIAVAAILVIVQDSLAVAFSLAGIAGLVRFRNALDDTKDAMYVFVAIAVGLGAGVGILEASAALSGLYNLVVIALWKWHTSQPVIADIALGEQRLPRGRRCWRRCSRDTMPNGIPIPSPSGSSRA